MLLLSHERYSNFNSRNSLQFRHGSTAYTTPNVRSSGRRSNFSSNYRRRSNMSGTVDYENIDESTQSQRPHLDDPYAEELIDEVCLLGSFKPSASLLVIGGGDWQFAKNVWKSSEAQSCVYADDDHGSVRLADQDDQALTVDCQDVSDPHEIAKLGKYDSVVVKNAFERLLTADDDVEEYLTDFFTSLYKVMKYGSRAILIVRLDYGYLLAPDEISAKLRDTSSKLSVNLLKQHAANCEFDVKHKSFKFQVCLEKEAYGKILAGGYLFKNMPALDEQSVEKFLTDLQEDCVKFEDKLDLLCLSKEMLDD